MVWLILTFLILGSIGYTFMLFAIGQYRRELRFAVPEGVAFVFVVPCLNEETVIGATIERLLSTPDTFKKHVIVVDDGSTDATRRIVEQKVGAHVSLVKRDLPNAAQGKGAALNAAYQSLLE